MGEQKEDETLTHAEKYSGSPTVAESPMIGQYIESEVAAKEKATMVSDATLNSAERVESDSLPKLLLPPLLL